MRGQDRQQSSMFSYLSPEQRVRKDHPLRTIRAMAEIVQYAKNEEARKIALGIEQRLWIDLLSRFHPGIGVQAGP